MKNRIKFSVVIPTRNRADSLKNLLNKIEDQTYKPQQVIIVDSSEIEQSLYKSVNSSVKYFHTTEKSAAKQRNLGMNFLNADTQVLFFLDDDTSPSTTYFEKMLNTLLSTNAVGVSGLAINLEKGERNKPYGLVGFLKKISFLDSSRDGVVTKSGIGIPVRIRNSGVIEVSWLIGCSCWDYQKIKNIRFEEDFTGYSLGEDVIFSVQAGRLGKLFVNSNIILNHLELPQSNSNIIEFNYMWVYYRFRLHKYVDSKIDFYLAFYLSILSKVALSLTSLPLKPITSIKQIIGLNLGLVNIFTDLFRR